MPNKKLRIVWLDGLRPFPENVEGYDLVAVDGFEVPDAYHPHNEHITRLWDVTCDGACDIVVIGNNTGSGQDLALAVAGPVQPYTIIVSNSPLCEDERAAYMEIGDFPNFGIRNDVQQLILEVAETIPWA